MHPNNTFKMISLSLPAWPTAFCCLCLGLVCQACSSARYSKASAPPMALEEAAISTASDAPEASSTSERLLIYDAQLTLSVEAPDSIPAQLAALAKAYKGYVQETGTSRNVLRVESAYLEEALDALARLGKVQDQRVSGRDVTEARMDLQLRLENAQKSRNRYLELLQQAANVTEILAIEKELERLNQTIESLEHQLQRMDHLIAYSTITVYVRERTKPGLLGYIGLGLYHSVKWLFVRN